MVRKAFHDETNSRAYSAINDRSKNYLSHVRTVHTKYYIPVTESIFPQYFRSYTTLILTIPDYSRQTMYS